MKPRVSGVLQRLALFRVTRSDPYTDVSGDWSLNESDVEATLVAHRPPPLLFGHVGAERLMNDLEQSGILDHVRTLGYTEFRPEFGGHDLFETSCRLYARHAQLEGDALLMDFRTHQGELTATSPLDGHEVRVNALILDWLGLTDPARPLGDERQALPGQNHPGLGIFRRAYRLTRRYLRESGFDVVVNVPEYFHNAVLYSGDFKFFEPVREGRFQAMKRDLLRHGLARVSHALAQEGDERVVLRGEDRAVHWTPAEQVMALGERMRKYFEDVRYVQAFKQERGRCRYALEKVKLRDA